MDTAQILSQSTEPLNVAAASNSESKLWEKLRELRAWGRLRMLASSRLAQASIAFPFFGYIVLYSEAFTARNLDQINTDLGSHTFIPTLDKIYIIYFGLLLVGVGIAAVNFFCPWVIKRFNDPKACADFYMQMADARHVLEVVGKIPDKDVPPRSEEILRELKAQAVRLSKDPIEWRKFLELNRESIYGLHVNWYGSHQWHRRPLRWTCALLIYVGMLLLAIPSGDTFIGAMRITLGRFL